MFTYLALYIFVRPGLFPYPQRFSPYLSNSLSSYVYVSSRFFSPSQSRSVYLQLPLSVSLCGPFLKLSQPKTRAQHPISLLRMRFCAIQHSRTIMPMLCMVDVGPHRSWLCVASMRRKTSLKATLENAPKMHAETSRPLRLARKLIGTGTLRYPPRWKIRNINRCR